MQADSAAKKRRERAPFFVTAEEPPWPSLGDPEVTNRRAARAMCRLFGHKIGQRPWVYEQGETTLDSGETVPVTWASCEICSRCDMEVWTPW